jgi:hypothetical protein
VVPAVAAVETPAVVAPAVADGIRARPENVPETYWDAGKGELKVDDLLSHFTEAQSAQATLAERAAAVPKTAADYKIELADTTKVPAGFELDLKNPLYAEAAAAAHEMGLTQAEFNRLANIQIAQEVAKSQSFVARMAEEKVKLGPKADERIAAVTQALVGRLGDGARPIVAMLISAAHVEALEGLLTSGEVPFSQSGRAAPRTDGKPDGWENLSATDRRTFHLAQNKNARR